MKKLLCVLVFLLLVPPQAFANTAIGNVLIAKGVVTASINNSGLRTLSKGSEVFLGETVSTASDSFVVLKMTDQSKLSLRPSSEITLEKFTQESGKEEALFDLIKGGLRAISGDIGKKRPEEFKVETSIATVGIRGTDFIVRLCAEDCSAEELSMGQLPQKNAGPTGGDPTKRKKLKKLDQSNNSARNSFIECKPAGEIKRGLYVAVLEGKIYVRTDDEEIELEAVEAVFAEEREMLCLGTLPNFLSNDSYLSDNPGETVTLYNILKNIDEERQRCEIPEA
ncbi:MAG: FecR family protein [Acidiferrobacterales bacterium]|nr:FecR family protein [Acidiferrobacterales bacterium]